MRSLIKFIGWTVGVVGAEAWATPRVLECAERCATGRRRIAEIGVWQGAATCRMRGVMHPDGVLFAIDPYPSGRLGFSYQQLIARREVARIARGQVVWLRERGAAAARHPVIQAAPFDFALVDADHTTAGLTENWNAWAPLVGANGLLALHEGGVPGGLSDHGTPRFCDTVAQGDPRFEVKERVEEAYELIRAERLEGVVGLHLNFTDGAPLTDGMKGSARFCVDGRFRFPLAGRGLLPLPSSDQQLVRNEAVAQFARARTAGFPITHLDSHHHVHMTPNMASVLLAVATALGVRRVRRFSNCGPHEGWFRRLKGAVFGRQLKRMDCEWTEYFGDLEDIRWMIAHRKPIDGSLEIVTHPTLRSDGAIVDGKDRDELSERILGLRPFFPSLINEAGRINRPSAP